MVNANCRRASSSGSRCMARYSRGRWALLRQKSIDCERQQEELRRNFLPLIGKGITSLRRIDELDLSRIETQPVCRVVAKQTVALQLDLSMVLCGQHQVSPNPRLVQCSNP